MTNQLVKGFLKEISYDNCEVCGSFWLDATELDKLAWKVEGSIEYSSRKKAEESSERKKPCPRCEDVELDKVVYKVVGVFSDAGGDREERNIYAPVSTIQLIYKNTDDIDQIAMTFNKAIGMSGAK